VDKKSTGIRYINQLRILAIYMVVTAHIAIWTAERQQPFSFIWWAGNYIHLIALWTVPVFVMISGALLLEDRRGETALAFYKRRLRRIAIPILFWTVVYILARKYINGENLSPAYVADLILTATPYYHLWFLYMIPGLYLLTPLLRIFIKHSTHTDRLFAISLILILAAAYCTINILHWGNQRSVFTVFIPYIGYYLCGYELRFIDPNKVPRRYLILAVVISALYIAVLTGPFVDHHGYAHGLYVFDFFSPPVIVLAVAIYWAVYLINNKCGSRDNHLLKSAEAALASATLGIYVFHPLVLEYMRFKMAHRAAEQGYLISLLVGPMIAYLASWAIVSLMMNVPLLRRTVC